MALGCTVLAAVCLACTRPSTVPPPNIVLIVIDTLRADHVGAYGYPRPTSPNIDRLAAAGVLFGQAHAPSSWTKPSVASLFTSRHPSEHGAVAFQHHLAPEIPTLAELLRDAGYRTLGVSGNFVHVSEDTGLARGFDDWVALSMPARSEGNSIFTDMDPVGAPVYRRAPTARELNREALQRVPEVGERPLFLYLHYMEPHSAYAPPAPWRRAMSRDPNYRTGEIATSSLLKSLARGEEPVDARDQAWLVDLYDAEIASVDAALGNLLAALERRGYGENTIVWVLSDHGEEFGEHGSWFHGISLHGESLRIPMMFRDFRTPMAGVQKNTPVDLLDVAPSILSQAGAKRPKTMEGRDLSGEGPLPERDLVAELHADPPFEANVAPRSHTLAILRWPWKAIAPREQPAQIFRIDRDAGEQREVPPEEPAPRALAQRLVDLLSNRTEPTAAEGPPIDAETLEGLRALGYAD
ncbi:sulfatase [Myxococcota bacterium]|nr:sulfatase [Myxococcota bacterium]